MRWLRLVIALIAGTGCLAGALPALAAGTSARTTQGTSSAIDTIKGTVPMGANVSAAKTVSGNFAEGGVVTYTIVLSNNGPVAQGDNAGHEFTDIVAPELLLLSATASSGTTAVLETDVVSWHGTIAPSASVTINIEAEIVAAAGAWVSNQSFVVFDGDGNGTNESYTISDDPTVGGSEDATVFVVEASAATPIPAPANIPALGQWAQALLLMLLGGLGLWAIERRSQG